MTDLQLIFPQCGILKHTFIVWRTQSFISLKQVCCKNCSTNRLTAQGTHFSERCTLYLFIQQSPTNSHYLTRICQDISAPNSQASSCLLINFDKFIQFNSTLIFVENLYTIELQTLILIQFAIKVSIFVNSTKMINALSSMPKKQQIQKKNMAGYLYLMHCCPQVSFNSHLFFEFIIITS